jgi:hypothetical protein
MPMRRFQTEKPASSCSICDKIIVYGTLTATLCFHARPLYALSDIREANGRKVARAPQSFVDTKTTESAHRRQQGLLYLIDREFSLPFGDWVNQVIQVRNRYATAHHLPVREGTFDWQDTATLHSQAINREH